MDNIKPIATLDVRKTKCPLNFVKTKLALEKLNDNDILEIWVDLDGESAINIPSSVTQEGHQVLKTQQLQDEALQKIWIKKHGT